MFYNHLIFSTVTLSFRIFLKYSVSYFKTKQFVFEITSVQAFIIIYFL